MTTDPTNAIGTIDPSTQAVMPEPDPATAGKPPSHVKATSMGLDPDAGVAAFSKVLGEIVWLMGQSTAHRQMFISDLEWLMMTPLMNKQFRMFYQELPGQRASQRPVGVAFWAFASQEVEDRLLSGNSRLQPQDWTSGDRAWLTEVIAPFGGGHAIVQDIKAKVFPDRDFRVLTIKDGKREARLVPAPKTD